MRLRLLALIALAALGAAHPMGNFSVSHYIRLEPGARGLQATYVLDLAEVPTYTLLRDWKLDAKGPQAALEAKAADQARQWAKGLEFHAGLKLFEPQLAHTSVRISDGTGGLSVMRIELTFLVPDASGAVDFEDRNFPDRAGWKEIVVRAGPGAQLVKASQGEVELSKALTVYPPDPAPVAPQDLRASVEWQTLGAPVPAGAPRIVPIPQPKPVSAPAGLLRPRRRVFPKGRELRLRETISRNY